QALGPSFDVDAVLHHYDDAVDHGFTSFGFCFDDTDHDPFEVEFGLLETIVDRLTERLGVEPEFFFCPRFYWFPGQLDYSWLAAAMGSDALGGMLGTRGMRTAEEAAERQVDYLRRLGAVLPTRTNLYLANWWSGTTGDWAAELAAGWTDLIGRPPVFWDNQQQNDYRAAAVYPLALHQRPPELARRLAGYCLNSSRPLSAFAHSSVTSGAWAWNPDGYDGGGAAGAAVIRFYGDAAPAVIELLTRLERLMAGLLAPRAGPEHHYRGLAKADPSQVSAALAQMADLVGEAEQRLSPRAHPLATDALHEYRRELDRLRLDLDVGAGDQHAVAAVAALLAERLPSAPEGQATSWRLHFLDGPMRQVRRAAGGA
ncbi:MAG: beta-N-acetylglucosaminidase, partial [Acidimicrobiaceae bacterium]|nr:beta-N-acetylglucosaminidase [Acidimicrobiaceae bacterium]